MPTKIEISARTIFFILLTILGIWFLHQIYDILLLLFIAFTLTSAINPLVDRLEAKKIPRSLAILLIYLVGILVVALISSTIFPPLITQSIHLGNQLPTYLSHALAYLNLGSINPDTLTNQLGLVGESLFRITIGLFSNIVTVLTILVFTFYFLLERKHLDGYISSFWGQEVSHRVITIIQKIEDRLGAWVRGELLLMVVIGVASFIGLTLLQVEYALALAIIAGLLEIVPVIGPIISAVPGIVVAFSTSSSPLFAVVVAVLYFTIQQLENNLVVPTVMRKAVDLPPIVTLLALIIGGRLGGTGGAILAVPFVVTIRVLVSELLVRKSQSV